MWNDDASRCYDFFSNDQYRTPCLKNIGAEVFDVICNDKIYQYDCKGKLRTEKKIPGLHDEKLMVYDICNNDIVTISSDSVIFEADYSGGSAKVEKKFKPGGALTVQVRRYTEYDLDQEQYLFNIKRFNLAKGDCDIIPFRYIERNDQGSVLIENGRGTATYKKKDLFNFFDLSRDGRYLVMDRDSCSLLIKNLVDENSDVFLKEFYTTDLSSLKIHPDNKFVASGYNNGTLDLWDLTGKHIRSFSAHKCKINTISFSNTEDLIVTGGDDGLIKIWNEKGILVQTFKGHNNSLQSVKFSQDNRYLISASDDGTIKIWNITTGKSLTYVFIDKETPVIYDDYDNFFCYQNGFRYVNFVEGKQVVTSKQLINAFFREDLVKTFFTH